MTNKEIIKKINNAEWSGEGDPLYAYEQLDSAMNAARKDEAIAFDKWIRKNGYLPDISGWYKNYGTPEYERLTTEQLYELFKQTK